MVLNNSNTVLRNNKPGGSIYPHFKTYYKALVPKTDRPIDQWNINKPIHL